MKTKKNTITTAQAFRLVAHKLSEMIDGYNAMLAELKYWRKTFTFILIAFYLVFILIVIKFK